MPQPTLQSDLRRNPVMKETGYDRTSSGMMAAAALLAGVTLLLVAVWFTNRRPPPPEPTPFEIIEMPGGFEDGDPNASPDLESPAEEIPDPSIAETSEEQPQMTELLETIVDLSEQTTDQVEMVIQADAEASSGKVGSSTGNGKRPLGTGGLGKGGFSREQRWVVKFDEGSIEEYARQLDFFKIEVGALFPDGRLVFLSNVSRPNPTVREVKTGAGENRLYMTWRGGNRKDADVSLFGKAKLNASNATLMHFYAPETENLLAQIEVAYRNRKSTEIRRTYFNVRPEGTGYRFVVTSQSYLR